MTETQASPRWLNHAEMRSWRAYVVGTNLLRRQLHRELTDAHKLSLVDYEVLVVLSERDGSLRMSELARFLGATKSKLSHQIARLESAGLVTRRLCPDDARGVLAELTDEGTAVLRQTAPTHVDGVRDHLVDLMTPEEQAVVSAVFERVITHLDTLVD